MPVSRSISIDNNDNEEDDLQLLHVTSHGSIPQQLPQQQQAWIDKETDSVLQSDSDNDPNVAKRHSMLSHGPTVALEAGTLAGTLSAQLQAERPNSGLA